MKSILFVTEYSKRLEIKDVDTEKLEGTAKSLAELIITTENADDLSKVYVKGPKIDLDFMEEMLQDDEEVERIKRVFGEEIQKEGAVIIWTWDKLGADETPEQYFERHARKIDNLGGKIINYRGKMNMNNDSLRKRTTWVRTYSDAEAEEVGKAREILIKKSGATFNVCSFEFNSDFHLLNDSTEFIVAKELGIPITLLEYDENDFIHINECRFTPDQLTELANLDGNIRVGDLFERYSWEGGTHKIEAGLIKTEPVYALTDKEQEMKISTPFESGVAIHQAYIDLGMTEESDIDIYMQYYIKKMKNMK